METKEDYVRMKKESELMVSDEEIEKELLEGMDNKDFTEEYNDKSHFKISKYIVLILLLLIVVMRIIS